MKTRRENDGTIIVNLERGEMLRAAVESLAAANGVVCARVAAIGALEAPELGYYRLDRKEYVRRTFPGILELVSLEGNLALREGKPFLHAHVSVSGEDFAAHGGHLFDARVGVVVEMFITPYATPLARVMRGDVGLACWEPGTKP
ncbi:MAG TPA: DUF296 domain-containing protein [Patescibacteria group bacterium]|nr:DUF296 domain-containing protein [Patescibacteria group bacterium]